MQRFSALIMLLILLGIGLSSCSKDEEGPAGPSLVEPTNLTATGLSDQAIQLTWAFTTGRELGFKIHRANADADNWAEIAPNLPANSHLYIDSDLAEGSSYQYRIKAFSRNVESGWSNLATGTTWPKAPAALTAARVDGHTINITWVDSSNSEEGFEIQRKRRNAADYTSVDTAAANITAFTDVNLPSSVTFTYRVRALKGSVASTWSPTGSATTTIYVPPAPTGFRGEAISDSEILLSWTNDHIFNELGYVLEFTTNPEGVWTVDSIPQVNQRQKTVSELTAATLYHFRVYAYNDSGPSDKTPAISVETQPGPPAAPLNPAAVAPDYQTVVFTWTDNSADEDSFIVERKFPADTRWTRLGTTESNIQAFEDTNLRPLTRYLYHVCAANRYGPSAWTAPVEVATPDGPPNTPALAAATALGIDRIRLTWGDRSQNEDGFIIERMMTGEPEFTLLTAVGRSVTSVLDTGLTIDTEYNYRVKAFNANYESAYSNIATARTWSYIIQQDDFESYTAGNPPGNPWQVTVRGFSTITVVAEDQHQGDKSVKIDDALDGSVNNALLLLQHRSVNIGYFDVWLKIGPNSDFELFAVNRDNFFAWQILFHTDLRIFCRNDNTNTIYPIANITWTPNQWMHLRVEFDIAADLYDIYLDDQLIADDLNMQNIVNVPINQLIFRDFNSNTTVSFAYIDDLIIEQSPAPQLNRIQSIPSNLNSQPVKYTDQILLQVR